MTATSPVVDPGQAVRRLPAGFATVPSTVLDRKNQLTNFAIASVGISGAFVFAGFGGAPDRPIICPLRALTGIPCPLCNMSHSFAALAGGHLRQAVVYSPFGPLLFALFALGAVALAILLVRRRRLVAPRPVMWAWWSVVGVLTMITWAYEIAVYAT